jgi:uncharacterized protein Yka (UPF0111/DUF47 family)
VARLSLSRQLGGLFGQAPEYDRFYDLFRQAGENVEATTKLLLDLLESWPDGSGLRREIVDREHRGDALTHDILHALHRKASSPLPSRDAIALAGALDDIVDLAEEASDFLGLYRVEAPMDQAIALADTLALAGQEVAAALADIEDLPAAWPHLREIKRLENEGDRLLREGLTALFDGGVDPMMVIRWKDIFERVEDGIDACDRVAHLLRGISVKQA